MKLSKILGFSPDYLAKLQVANVSTDRDLADHLNLDSLSHQTGIPARVLMELSELAVRNVEVSSKRIRTLGLIAVLMIGLILTLAAWLKIKSDFASFDQNANFAKSYIKDGAEACSQNRISEGIESYNSAINIIPKLDRYKDLEARAHYGLGTCYLGQQRFSLAALQFEEATDEDPQNPYYQFQLGLAYLSLQKPNNAITPFKKAHEILPDNFQDQKGGNMGTAELWLGIAYFQNQEYERALYELRFLDSNPLSKDAKYLLESALGQALYRSAMTPAFYKSNGDNLYELSNRISDAISHLQSAIKLEKDHSDDHAILGMALLKQGKSPEGKHEAEIECQKALKLDPGNEDAQTCLDSIPHK